MVIFATYRYPPFPGNENDCTNYEVILEAFRE